MADFVQVLLGKADDALVNVERLYIRDVASRSLSDDLLYDIRSVVQDCQSALDATATRVKEKWIKKSNWKPYFPLGINPLDFSEKLEQQLKGLATDQPTIAAAFDRHQPYHAGNAELGYLHKLARANKHSDFSEQTRSETREIRSGPGGGVIQSGGARIAIGEGAVIRTGQGAGIRFGGPGPVVSRNIIQKVLVGWSFVDPPVPVLSTLQNLVAQTRAAVQDIHNEAAL